MLKLKSMEKRNKKKKEENIRVYIYIYFVYIRESYVIYHRIVFHPYSLRNSEIRYFPDIRFIKGLYTILYKTNDEVEGIEKKSRE